VHDDKTLTKIGALLRQAERTDNEHEADAFLQAAQRLATAASIDLAAARAHTADRERRVQPIQRSVGIGEPGTRGLRTYVELFLEISHANDVRCDIARNSATVYCYGFEPDVATCEALYASLAVQMVRGSDAYIKSGDYKAEIVGRYVTRSDGLWTTRRWVEAPVHASTARINFQQAFARRVGKRLAQAREQAEADAVNAERRAGARSRPGAVPTTSSTEIVLRQKELELRDFYTAHSNARGSWRGYRATAGYASRARRAGDRAGRVARLGAAREIGGGRRALGSGAAGR
jgi:hypothetical protein